MNYKLIITPEAELDASESAIWYNEQSIGLGAKFLEALDIEISYIKSNPELFAVRYKETRVAHVKRFSYGIHYIIDSERIVILAILHTSRNPQLWKER